MVRMFRQDALLFVEMYTTMPVYWSVGGEGGVAVKRMNERKRDR
jgi:hypothetical protein